MRIPPPNQSEARPHMDAPMTITTIGSPMSRQDQLNQLQIVANQIRTGADSLCSIAAKTLTIPAYDESKRASNIAASLTDLIGEATHHIASVFLDGYLRSYPTVYDAHGVKMHYRGSELPGLRFASQSGEFQHHIKITSLHDNGFKGCRDGTFIDEAFVFDPRETTNGGR